MWSHPSGQKFPRKTQSFRRRIRNLLFQLKLTLTVCLGMIKFHRGDVTVYGWSFVKLLVQLAFPSFDAARRDKHIWPRVGRVYEKFLTMTSMSFRLSSSPGKIDKTNCWASRSWSSRCDAFVMNFRFSGMSSKCISTFNLRVLRVVQNHRIYS